MPVLRLATTLAILGAFACSQPAAAAVVIFDGFADADLDNNGLPLEPGDVDLNLDDTPGNTFEPDFFPGAIVQEVMAVQDASDTGLPWFFARGFTSGGTGDPKPNIKIAADVPGSFPETGPMGVGWSAIDDGLAMTWEAKGRGGSAIAVFPETIALGPQVGDQVKVSFDFRVWSSAPNDNPVHPPVTSELRFGLFQDTDGQLGMSNPVAGRFVDTDGDGFVDPTAAVWGAEGGQFRGDAGEVGANGDHGWYARIQIEDPNDPLNFAQPNGGFARVVEETNEQTPFDTGNDLRFLEGTTDFVAGPADVPDFVNLDLSRVYQLALTLERATELTSGDTIKAIFEVTDRATSETWTLQGVESLEESTSGMVPIPGSGGPQSDAWDYFGIRNTGFDDLDFILDNFKLEVFGSNEPSMTPTDFDQDGDVDSEDLFVWQANFGNPSGAATNTGDADGDQDVDGKDFLRWQASFGTAAAAATALPEPSSALLLLALSATLICTRRIANAPKKA